MRKFTTLLLIVFTMFTGIKASNLDLSSNNPSDGDKSEANIISKANRMVNKFERYNINQEALQYSLMGYLSLKEAGKLKKDYLVVIDFSKSSNEKRFYLIKPEEGKVLHSSVVAHGRNSGIEFATRFSNRVGSNASSLGFYITDNTYYGKHGLSLRLNGLERGFNDNARKRAVVIHSAEYANPSFAKKYGRLGRSFGCPSLPESGYDEVIETIKEGALLFIYYPAKQYLDHSPILSSLDM